MSQSLSYNQGIDEIYGTFHSFWLLNGPDPESCVMLYEAIGKDAEPPLQDADYLRVSIRHLDPASPPSLGSPGSKIYSREGVVTVQLFAVASQGDGRVRAGELATIAARAFEGRQSPRGVWFRNVVIREIGIDGNHFNINVTASFQYDEIR